MSWLWNSINTLQPPPCVSVCLDCYLQLIRSLKLCTVTYHFFIPQKRAPYLSILMHLWSTVYDGENLHLYQQARRLFSLCSYWLGGVGFLSGSTRRSRWRSPCACSLLSLEASLLTLEFGLQSVWCGGRDQVSYKFKMMQSTTMSRWPWASFFDSSASHIVCVCINIFLPIS